MAVDDTLRIDLTETYAAIDQLFATFMIGGQEAAQVVGEAIRGQLADLEVGVDVTLADAEALGAYVDEAVNAAGPVVDVGVDQASIAAAVDEAIGAADSEVALDVDPAPVTEAIESGIADADTSVPLEVGTVDSGGLDQVGDSLQRVEETAGGAATGLLSVRTAGAAMQTTAAAATGSTAALTSGLSSMAGGMGGVVAGGGALIGVLGAMVSEAAQAQQATLLANRTFGESAAVIETIHFGNLTGDLSALALQLGADDDQMRVTMSTIGQLAQAEGETQDQSAQLAAEFAGLATVVSATHPQLGTTSQVLDNLLPRLARGGRFVAEMGLSFNAADLAVEAQRQGITKTVAEMSILERATLGMAIANRQLGASAAQDVAQGAESATVQFRAFRQSIREDLESAGTALLPLATSLTHDLQPAIAGLISLIGKVGTAVITVLGPILAAVGPQLGELFTQIGTAIETLQPLFELIGAVLAKVLPIVVSIGTELFKWTTPLGLTLQVLNQISEHADDLKSKFGGAGESIDDMARSLGEVSFAQSGESLTEWTNKIHAAEEGAAAAGVTLEQWRAAADRAGVSVTDVATITAALNAEQAAQSAQTESLTADLAGYVEQTEAAALSTGTLFDAISQESQASASWASILGAVAAAQDASTQAVREANAGILDNRGLVDDAFFALQRLGDQGPGILQLLSDAYQNGSLSQSEFTATARNLGLSFDELGAIEAKAATDTDAFRDSVDTAIGSITDATQHLSDEGKANIDRFVADLQQQAMDAAAFSNSIQALFARGADDLAQALLAAGPAAAGAARQAAEASDDQLSTLESNTEQTKRLYTESKAGIDEYAGGIVSGTSTIKGAFGEIGPAASAAAGDIDVAMLAAERAVSDAGPEMRAAAVGAGGEVAGGVAEGMDAGLGGIVDAARRAVRTAVEAARSEAEVGSPSRLFSRDVGFPLTEGVAEGILAGMFKVEDAIGEVIAGAQQHAQEQLDTVFGALRAGMAVDDSRDRLHDLDEQYTTLSRRQIELPAALAAAQGDLNRALAEAQVITAREQQAIERAQANVDDIRAKLQFQTTGGPQQLDEAQRILGSSQAEADRLRAAAQTAADNAALGTGTDADARAAQQAFNAAQRQVADAQQAVDDLTAKMQNNRVTQNDLQVALEDLGDAQRNAVGTTDDVRDATQRLKDLQDEQTQVTHDLLDVTNQIPAAQLAVMEATARAAAAGEAFNQQGLAGIDILGDIARQAGFSDQAIAKFARTWAGLASTIATSLGGGQFGAPGGMVDIGTILGQGQRFTDPTEALNELNFVRGLQGATTSLTMAQAPWNINIYQATDPNAVAFAVGSKLGLAGVR